MDMMWIEEILGWIPLLPNLPPVPTDTEHFPVETKPIPEGDKIRDELKAKKLRDW